MDPVLVAGGVAALVAGTVLGVVVHLARLYERHRIHRYLEEASRDALEKYNEEMGKPVPTGRDLLDRLSDD